jgi:hypothetical protein
MKKFGIKILNENIDNFHSVIVGLKKLEIRFHVDGEFIWVFENELDKLSTDKTNYFLSMDDGSVFSFHQIENDDLKL